MAKRKSKAKGNSQLSPSVANVTLPPRKNRGSQPSVGSGPTHPVKTVSPLKTKARYAGDNSGLFPKGGEAFERWCASKGISSRERRSADEWSDLLEEFASRPIHGLRRGPSGGNHKASKSDLRR